jgi:proline iminopeptidase
MTKALVLAACLAALVACAPADQPTPESPIAAEPTALENGSFTADLNGFDIHYEVHGTGPVVMTVPNSWGLSLEGLRALYRPLELRLTLVYFDPRGMGESSPAVEPADMGMAAVRSDFDALRRHLGLETVNAIGWSNGAMNLIYLAAELGSTIDAAIFLHGSASFTQEDMVRWAEDYPDTMRSYAEFMQRVQDPDLSDDDRTALMLDLWSNEWFPLMAADVGAAPELLGPFWADAEFSWPHADYANQENPTFDARDRLPAITARSLVIAGAADMMPIAKSEEIADGIADAELVVFGNSGHFAPLEEPERFVEVVTAFLSAP